MGILRQLSLWLPQDLKDLVRTVQMTRGSSMSTPNVSAPADDNGFLAQLLPNRGRARFLRGFIWIFLAVGVLGGLSLIWDVYADLHARHTWPLADGEVVSASQKDSKGVPGATSTEKHTRYWVEYEVRFAVPADQCKTGTVSADEDSMPCWGIVRTRSTSSPYTVYDWLIHGYPKNSHVQILHDPNGPDVKIAGESAWLVYRWDKIFLMSGWSAFFLTFHTIVQRRLEYLETLPEDYDAFPSRPSPQPGADDLIDLKLP
jgi:hypothetical protein